MAIELAGCVIIDDYDRVLLLHRSKGERTQWELPGGKVEQDELPEVAAVRELYEELGVEVRLTAALGTGEFEEDDKSYKYHWFQAKIQSGSLTLMEPDTFDDYDYFEMEDLLSLSLSANMTVLLEKIFAGEVVLSQ